MFVPSLYMAKPGVAEKIEAYVAAGGTAVLTYFSGIVDECDRVHLGGYPAPFRKLLGLRVEEWAVPPDDRKHKVRFSKVAGFKRKYETSFWAEVIRTEGAETVATFGDGCYAGLPAVTCHRFGKGEAWYLGTQFGPEFHADLVRCLAKRTGTKAP